MWERVNSFKSAFPAISTFEKHCLAVDFWQTPPRLLRGRQRLIDSVCSERAGCCCRAEREQPEGLKGISPKSQDQILILTFSCVPSSLDTGVAMTVFGGIRSPSSFLSLSLSLSVSLARTHSRSLSLACSPSLSLSHALSLFLPLPCMLLKEEKQQVYML